MGTTSNARKSSSYEVFHQVPAASHTCQVGQCSTPSTGLQWSGETYQEQYGSPPQAEHPPRTPCSCTTHRFLLFGTLHGCEGDTTTRPLLQPEILQRGQADRI